MNKFGEYDTCYICNRCCITERHHVFGASNRRKSERYKLVVNLCHDCHNEPPNGVHFNADAMDKLRQEFQRKAMQENNWTIADFRAVFHKNYLDEME